MLEVYIIEIDTISFIKLNDYSTNIYMSDYSDDSDYEAIETCDGNEDPLDRYCLQGPIQTGVFTF